MGTGADAGGRELLRVRLLTLVWLSTTAVTSLLMPGIGLWREDSRWRMVLGACGMLIFTAALAGALFTAVDPSGSVRRRRRWLLLVLAATAVSLPTVGGLAAGQWPSWAWLGACVIGAVPLLVRPRVALLIALAITVLSVLVGLLNGVGAAESVTDAVLITAGIGSGIAVVNWMPIWVWRLLVQAERGKAATAEMVAATERLRFARDVHDLLGHNLTVIVLKAELLERLIDEDSARARQQAAQIHAVATTALDEVRQTVHRYREVDVDAELDSARQVLDTAGIDCVLSNSAELVTGAAAVDLVAVVRETTTNILKHSSATTVRMTIGDDHDRVVVRVSNDGAGDAVFGDPFSSGLAGLKDRLAERGGAMQIVTDRGQFILRAEVPR